MLIDNDDKRDMLFIELEKQASDHNRARSYQPTGRDVVRAYRSSLTRPNVLIVPLIAILAALGWLKR